MRNAILPPSPVSSQLYNFGNDEVQMPDLGLPSSMGSHQLVNGYGGGFCSEPKIFNEDNQHQLRSGGFAAIPYQTAFSYRPGYQSASSNCDNIAQQSMLLFKKKDSIPDIDMSFPTIQKRKRSIEVTSLLPGRGVSSLVDNKNTASNEYWKKNKRKMADSSDHQSRESINIQEKLLVPARRSQKLSDKITALQKLVSPYGKTDTASVLQEASLYIKLLQDQIQNLFEMLSSSYNNVTSPHYSQVPDLKSRGLCLVPISFTSKLTQEGRIDSIL